MKIVTKELLSPTDLMGAQALYIHKLTEIIMIDKYKNLILTTFQVVVLSFKGFNNSQEILILSFITSFY